MDPSSSDDNRSLSFLVWFSFPTGTRQSDFKRNETKYAVLVLYMKDN